MSPSKFEARAKASAAIDRHQIAVKKLNESRRFGPSRRAPIVAEENAAYKAMIDALAECRAIA